MNYKKLTFLLIFLQGIIYAQQNYTVPDYTSFPKQILAAQKKFDQDADLRTEIPQKMAAGQNGYLIMTNEYVKNNSTELQNFIKQKESKGFKVTVATEKDWGEVENSKYVKQKGRGRLQADRVREWLQGKYQQLNLLYALIIENPHPDEGRIPMAKFQPKKAKIYTPDQKKDYAKFIKIKDDPKTADGAYYKYNGEKPSDYYYADLTSEWDANGNSVLCDKEDYASGKIDGQANVYVGRIPYYGEKSEYAKLEDVDIILRRTIDFENATGDLKWRKDMFYVGGADNRFKSMQDNFLNYNGAIQTTYRVSQGYGYEPTSQKWNAKIIRQALNKDEKKGFVLFQEHGSAHGMAGQINVNEAHLIKRTTPSFLYFGGCDVASPEHHPNIVNTMFRKMGVGAIGATRSVTGLGGDDDTTTIAGYARLYFGQSQGEAHWRALSDYVDTKLQEGGKIGMSNFLLNLQGDPSLVIMPKSEVSPLIISPNIEVLKVNHQQKSKKDAGYTFTLANTTNKAASYKIKGTNNLSISSRSFNIPAKSTKDVKVLFKNGSKLLPGVHNGNFTVTTKGKTVTRKIALTVYGRSTLFYAGFDTKSERDAMVGYKFKKKEQKEEIEAAVEPHNAGHYAFIPKYNRADLRREKVVPGEADATVAFKFKYQGPLGKDNFVLTFGKTHNNFFIGTNKQGKFTTSFTTQKGNADKETSSSIITPTPKSNEWHTVITWIDRAAKEMVLILDGTRYTTAFTPKPSQGLLFDRLRLGKGSKKDRTDLYFDNLGIFDYVLNEEEIKSFTNNEVINLTFPKNGDKAHPNGVSLSWAADIDREYVILFSETPSFKNVKKYRTTKNAYTVKGLKDKTLYYWKVGTIVNGKENYTWDSFNTFTTDGSLPQPKIKINTNKGLKTAIVKDNTYSDNLGKVAKAFLPPTAKGKRKKADLFFSMVEGDEWLRCASDGTLTTNFGAPDAGTYKYKFSVSTQYGAPQFFEINIRAVNGSPKKKSKKNAAPSNDETEEGSTKKKKKKKKKKKAPSEH